MGFLGRIMKAVFGQPSGGSDRVAQEEVSALIPEERVKQLLAEHPDAFTAPSKGPSKFAKWCFKEDPEVVRLLIREGGNINEKVGGLSSTESLLMSLASSGRYEIVKVFIEHGADVNYKSPKGETPLIAACQEWKNAEGIPIADRNERLKIVKLLLENGAIITDDCKGDYKSPMDWARLSEDEGILGVLEEHISGKRSSDTSKGSSAHQDLPETQHAAGSAVEETTEEDGLGSLLISAQKMEATLETISYDGGSVEQFYERMSKELMGKHGALVAVDYLSHFPNFEIYFAYEDGMRIYSGRRTGQYDIHFLTLGYVGEGPRYTRHFLSAAGFDLTTDQIKSIKPGDSILLEDGKAIIQKRKDKAKDDDSGEVKFLRERNEIVAGAPATYRHYSAPDKEAAKKFLDKQNITAQSYFVVVETPEGVISKDRMGIFEQ